MPMSAENIVLVWDAAGKTMIAHVADCPEARAAALRGEPVAVLYGIERSAVKHYVWHVCMADSDLGVAR